MNYNLETRRAALEVAHSATEHPMDVIDRAAVYLTFLHPHRETEAVGGVAGLNSLGLPVDVSRHEMSAADS